MIKNGAIQGRSKSAVERKPTYFASDTAHFCRKNDDVVAPRTASYRTVVWRKRKRVFVTAMAVQGIDVPIRIYQRKATGIVESTRRLKPGILRHSLVKRQFGLHSNTGLGKSMSRRLIRM